MFLTLLLKLPINGTRRYGPLRGPTSSSCGGLWPRLFFALQRLLCCLAHFDNFWCPVVTLVTFSSNISNFERNPKKTKNIQKEIQKISKNFQNLETQKSPKNPKIQKQIKKIKKK